MTVRPNTLWDAVVVGGGPAGLLLSAYLSPSLRVALLEKHSLGATDKFWLTNRPRLEKNGLADTIIFEARRATVGSFLGLTAEAVGPFAVVDDARLLTTLASRCRAAGVDLYEDTEALNCAWGSDALSVETTIGTFKTRLLVDASGGASPIAATFGFHRLAGFYSILGAHLQHITLASPDIVGAYVVRFGHPVPMFEVIPTGPSSAFCVVFVTTRRLVEPAALELLFQDHLRRNPFFRATTDTTTLRPKLGIIPVGRFVDRKLPGLLSFGESALIQSPLLGAAFNEVLDLAPITAERIMVQAGNSLESSR